MYRVKITKKEEGQASTIEDIVYYQKFEVLDIQIFARELNNSYWAKVEAPKEGE